MGRESKLQRRPSEARVEDGWEQRGHSGSRGGNCSNFTSFNIDVTGRSIQCSFT